MTGLLSGESALHIVSESGHSRNSQDEEEAAQWYFLRKEIEDGSPSRKDGIDLKKETYLRKSYCTFLQDLGMRLKVPQVTIATAIVFCHRFFIRQSHAKNDRRTIATVCMFLAGKVEETPRPLKDVILVSYEIFHKKDPAAAQRIKQKEVYEEQKEIILNGERVVLGTLAFDLNVHHPYKPLVEAIKKFKVAQNALAQVAWNFVNDGLRTSLCLQFRPHHIAAGAIFLAAKFLKVKLPSESDKVWEQEFDITLRQLKEISNQILELYEQNKAPQSHGSEMDGSTGAGAAHRAPVKNSGGSDEQVSRQVRQVSEHANADNRGVSSRTTQNQSNDNGSGEMGSVITDHKMETDTKDCQHPEQVPYGEDMKEDTTTSSTRVERSGREDQERIQVPEVGGLKEDNTPRKSSSVAGRSVGMHDGPVGQSPNEAIKMIDKDKVKAALEKTRKARGEKARKKDLIDDDDFIERALEDGVELAVEDEKIKQENRQKSSKSELLPKNEEAAAGYGEEGEMTDIGSPLNSRKRKGVNLPDRSLEAKKRNDGDTDEKKYSHV